MSTNTLQRTKAGRASYVEALAPHNGRQTRFEAKFPKQLADNYSDAELISMGKQALALARNNQGNTVVFPERLPLRLPIQIEEDDLVSRLFQVKVSIVSLSA